MTGYIIGSCVDFEKWEKQNNASIIDFVEGCLVDSLVYYCKRGIAFFFEHYLNPNSSGYEFLFFPHNETENNVDYDEAWKRIEEMKEYEG